MLEIRNVADAGDTQAVSVDKVIEGIFRCFQGIPTYFRAHFMQPKGQPAAFETRMSGYQNSFIFIKFP